MQNYRTLGVYIEETSMMPASIAVVETAIPAFVGYISRRKKGRKKLAINTPILIQSLEEYERIFGGPYKESFSIILQPDTAVTNKPFITIKPDEHELSNYLVYYCMRLYFSNGGGRCYIVSVGDGYDDEADAGSVRLADLESGLKSLENEEEPTLLVIPEAVKLGEEDRKTLHEAMLDQCGRLRNRFAILDVLELDGKDPMADCTHFRNNETGINHLDYGSAYYPSLQTTIKRSYDEKSVVITDKRKGVNRGSIDGKTLAELSENESHRLLCKQIKQELGKMRVSLYPSAAIAGVYARVDHERGVWKAPANVSLNLVAVPSKILSNQDQGMLNVDANSGKSINAIRSFEGRGTLVWGARTLAGNDNEWRYIPLRRLTIFIRKSIDRSVGPVLLEPNEPNTWTEIRSMISNFLTSLWRDGALAGTTVDKAYFVKAGLGETMTEDDIQKGRLKVDIGIAPMRPSEFIILKFEFKVDIQ